MFDIQDAVQYITEATGKKLNISLGVQQNNAIKDQMLVSIIATDFDEDYIEDEVQFIPNTKSFKIFEEEEKEEEEDSILPIFINE